MSLHIAQIGTGRVGRPTAYTIMCTGIANKITVCDTKPGLAKAFAEELYHAAASLNLDLEIIWCEKDEEVEGADIILISAGEPRSPSLTISRRDLVGKNVKIIKHIAKILSLRNIEAKYVVITNPVDVMAMVFKKYSLADFVIGTGTYLETLRFRSKLARVLGVQVSQIRGWVGGEHGDAAVILWSTVRINNLTLEEYTKSNQVNLRQGELDTYVKEISRLIIDNIGGTEYGPAAAFRDIVIAIAKNTQEIFPISTPIRWARIPDPVYVSVPLRLGKSIGPTLYDALTETEKASIGNAAKAIYDNYIMTQDIILKT